MIGFIIALKIEADPFIEHLGLSFRTQWGAMRLYGSAEFKLLLTGSGAMNAAMGTALMLHHYPDLPLVNFGFAGSGTEEDHTIGQIFRINKIEDHCSSRSFYPELILKSPFPEWQLITVSQPKTSMANQQAPFLFDMEASGFFSAVYRFGHLNRAHCFKMVSDFLDSLKLDKTRLKVLLAEASTRLMPYFQELNAFYESQSKPTLNEETIFLIKECEQSFKLTTSQTQRIKQAVRFAKTRDIDVNALLKQVMSQKTSTISDRAKLVNQMEEALVRS